MMALNSISSRSGFLNSPANGSVLNKSVRLHRLESDLTIWIIYKNFYWGADERRFFR